MTGDKAWLKVANYGVTSLVAAIYVATLVRVFFTEGIIKGVLAVAIPGVGVVICSIIRNLINAKRPYEVMNIDNYLDKKTAGKSFPSRHVFSVFIIGTVVFYFYKIPGTVLFLTGIFLCYLRVAAKVHFVRDVIAGALFGILLGSTMYLF